LSPPSLRPFFGHPSCSVSCEARFVAAAMRVKPQVQLETFSKVVEAIYDCAFDPNRWQGGIGLIAELCRSPTCIIAVHDYSNNRSELAYDVGGYEERFVRLHEEKYAAMNPFFGPLRLLSEGIVKTRAMLIDDAEFYESKFYQEWVRPQGFDDALTVKVLQTEHRIGWVSAHRKENQPRYGDTEVSLLNLLSPHVCRSLMISDALNLKTIRSEALEATLNALTSGVYLVDFLGRIIYMNRAAEQQIEKGDVLRIENNRLAPTDRVARSSLTATLDQAITNEAATPTSGFSLALPARKGAGLVASILPLTRGERQNICGAFAAKAAIFVQDSVVVPLFPGEGFAKLYGLTGSELRVLLAMAPGLSVKETAEMLGISETTAKTHLQHIYEKTGTSKQTELMHLFSSSTPPVRTN
jgi:DNA-binding CsgD family transcriptional regulator/PAS domain-containing protein